MSAKQMKEQETEDAIARNRVEFDDWSKTVVEQRVRAHYRNFRMIDAVTGDDFLTTAQQAEIERVH